MAKVKISGLANYNDSLDATNLGADFLGFYFVKESPKKVSEKMVIDIVSKLPPFVTPVGIFANEDQKVISKIVKKCGLKNIQFNGDEAPEFCKAAKEGLDVKVFKSFSVSDESQLAKIQEYAGSVDYFIIDVSNPVEDKTVYNYDLASKIAAFNVPVFISGAITAEDVEDFLDKAAPFGLDADGGIERLPKRKDYDKMNLFIRRTHGLK